ncbi:piwi-like protein Ago3 [Harmonia axyridis]|uniref:piwi-like protein Ago3 n=1 Tax=Harmonia axyridis TaxID=115357 RepID=UPI001E278818|nr:piwi-like protein Ago3 [Harmonia axyridis]
MGDAQAPKGRAALLEKLRLRKLQQVGIQPPQPVDPEPEAPPKPTGRAALLKKIQESRQKKVGSDVLHVNVTSSEVALPLQAGIESKDVSEITEEVSKLAITKERAPVTYRGETGKPVNVTSNYIRLRIEKDRGVFEYEVRFNPDVDCKRTRCRMVNQHMAEMGKIKMFDGGAVLYLPKLLATEKVHFECSLPTGEPVTMEIIYKRKKNMSECLHLYNVLFKKVMRALMYSQMGRNYYNMKEKYSIPQHRLEVYPGFAVTADELESGLLLCLDTQHRVLRCQNVYELMCELNRDPNFKENFANSVIGCCVLTRYNNKTYIIDDVAWDTSPSDEFETSDGSAISFIDYYKKQYNITIQNGSQPLLVNRKSIKTSDASGKVDRMVCLVPELCYLTGLTDKMRADFRVMKDVAAYTRVTPAQRVNCLRTYIQNVSKSAEAQQILGDWGLKLEESTIQMEGRLLGNETILFGDNKEFRCGNNADWTRALSDHKTTLPIDLLTWVVFYTNRDKNSAAKFAETMTRIGSALGCIIKRPQLVPLRDDRNESYIDCIKQYARSGTQCCVFICPTLRTDRYGIIKKMCTTQFPIASQVILSKTLANEQKARAIIQKIALQINCKLGGTLWTLRFPFKNWMIIGIDVYHPPKGSKSDSICAVISSLNESISRWFSMALPQKGELSEFYKLVFKKSLEQYQKVNGTFPSKIVIFRDGVGDGQLDHCLRLEVPQFEDTLRQFHLDAKLCFVVVQKRTNTRIFLRNSQGYANPEPGTVLDHTITRKYHSDFFLVPQNVRQGTVNPTHYIVLYDSCNFKPDHIQRLAFKLCHLYYNWSGTVRVPAPCQYAHKLAQLYGQYINNPVAPELADKLYYL